MDYTLEKKLKGFKQIAQEKLQTILCSIPYQKDLIIEPALIKPLEHVCVASWVKSKGVQRIFKFDPKNPPPKQQNVHVYFISANLLTFKHVLDQIQAHDEVISTQNPSDIKNFHIIVLPTIYSSFQILLEEEGLYGIVSLYRFNWDFIYLDESLLSLEIPQVFGDIFVHKDKSILSSIAQSLRIFNMVTGKPDIILSYGHISDTILEMIDRLNKSDGGSTSSSSSSASSSTPKMSDFSAMIIIDRNKDYPSCLLTPAIYSGLLLEVFRYKAGELEIQPNATKISTGKLDIFKVSSQQNSPTEQKNLASSKPTAVVRMNGHHDEIFAENRYKHFTEASNLVRTQAKSLGFEVQNLNKMQLNEMQNYVTKKLPKITEMKSKIVKHLNACEQIINDLAGNFQKQQSLEEDILNNTNRKQILMKIDEILTIDGHKFNTIRMLCLTYLSIGLTSDELTQFVRNYCNIFGHKYLYVFQSLAQADLLPPLELVVGKSKLLTNLQLPKFHQTEFQANANRLKLLTSYTEHQVNSQIAKACPSYVFNGSYIPLVAQLASYLLKAENIDDLAGKIGSVDKIKLLLSDYSDTTTSVKAIQQAIKRGELADRFPIKKRNLLVFIVGGVSYAEVAACNLISRLTGSKIVVASNCICSGSEITAAAF